LVEELDQSKFPECATQPGSGNPPFFDQPTGDPTIIPSSKKVASADDGSLITLLVAYTQAAETAAGGASSMASLIATAESETNTGLSVSGVTFSVDVVHTTKVSYTEPATFSEALNAITNTDDGEMDSIHGLRDTHEADLVVLLVDIAGSCGLGWLPETVSPFNSHLGFTVTKHSCATGNYTFAHEIGHNMGLLHDMYVDPQLTPYSYGHGFVNTTAQIRSIMAYNDECADSGFFCSRVNHWSALDRLYNETTVLGDEFATNNLALNNSAYAVANYRPILLIPDLQPIQPSGWDSGIVISNVTGTTTSAGVIYHDEPIYVDYNCANLGTGNAGQFRYGLYIDDVLETFIEPASLNAGFYSYKSDYAMGALPAGTYTFKVVCDYNGDISEFNENNNIFSRSFTITSRQQQVLDLQPIQPNGWDSGIVISDVTDTTTTAGVIYDDEPVYVDFNCYNSGPGNAGQFRYGLYIDDILIVYAEPPSLSAGFYSYVADYSTGTLPAGTYTFKVGCDYNDVIVESDENNNEFSRSFTILARSAACNTNMVADVVEDSTAVHEACESLILGPNFTAAKDSTVSASSGLEVELLPSFIVEQGATMEVNVCGQSLCENSALPMPYGCHTCVNAICDDDSSCCTSEFNATCLGKVATICGLVCE
jgi:hypothetical protein